MMIFQLLVVFFLSYALASASESTAPSLLHFSPQGTVKNVRQVTARFSQPMVPFGAPQSVASPFEIDCSEEGTQLWIDSRNWVYDFTRDLPAGIACTFRLRSDLTTLDGTPVSAQDKFHFSTGGPAIRSSRPYDGSKSIDEEQAFAVVLGTDATEESILNHVWFSIEGIQERVGIHILTGETHETLFKTLPRWLTSQGPVVLLQAKQRFPHAAKVNLVWGAGVTSKSGIATEHDQTLAFQTRTGLTLEGKN